MENDLNDIIDDFNNDETNSSYTISSEMDGISSNSDNIELTGLKRDIDEEFLFLNNNKIESDNESVIDMESSIIDKTYFTKDELNNRKDDIIKLSDVELDLPESVIKAREYQYNLIN